MPGKLDISEIFYNARKSKSAPLANPGFRVEFKYLEREQIKDFRMALLSINSRLLKV